MVKTNFRKFSLIQNELEKYDFSDPLNV
jgi:2-oxoisovalerate dehydrogenase E1 component beta subunit